MMGLDITLLRPLWLLALVPLALFGWWVLKRKTDIGAWTDAANPVLLQAMAAMGHLDGDARRSAPAIAALISAACAILALSGPAIQKRDALSYRNLDGVVFVIDASLSVTEDNSWPQLLTTGRFAISALGTRPGGLVVFAGDAYVATDMTRDVRQLGQTFSLIGPKTVPDRGSRPERGLALASEMLRQAGMLTGDVILVTDGEGLAAESLREAAVITSQNARLSVVAVHQITPAIEVLAKTGGGRTFALEDVDLLVDWLQSNARSLLEQQDFPLLFWSDFGRYLLIFALVPLVLFFRRQVA